METFAQFLLFCIRPRFEERFMRSGIEPRSRNHTYIQVSLFQIMPLEIGDFQFASFRRCELLRHCDRFGVENVDARYGEMAFRCSRLLLYGKHLLVRIEFHYSETFRVGDFFGEDAPPSLEALDRFRKIVFENVVPQDESARLVIEKIFREKVRFGQAARLFLDDERDIHAELPEHGTEQVEIIPGMVRGDDDEDILDAGADERIQRIED